MKFIEYLRNQIGFARLGFVLEQLNRALIQFTPTTDAGRNEKNEIGNIIISFLVQWNNLQRSTSLINNTEIQVNALTGKVLNLLSDLSEGTRFINFSLYLEKYQETLTEEDIWVDACLNPSVKNYSNYLNKFPTGRFRNQAIALTKELKLQNGTNSSFSGAILFAKVRGFFKLTGLSFPPNFGPVVKLEKR